jgi:hypothetical protein
MSKIAIHLDAGHDVNGNPKRLYLIVDSSREYLPIEAVIEEGYSGQSALNVMKLPASIKHRVLHLKTTAGEYQQIKKEAKQRGVYVRG